MSRIKVNQVWRDKYSGDYVLVVRIDDNHVYYQLGRYIRPMFKFEFIEEFIFIGVNKE